MNHNFPISKGLDLTDMILKDHDNSEHLLS